MARRAALLVLLPLISVAVALGGGAFAESVTRSADVLGTSQAAAAAPPSAKEVEDLSKQVGKLTTKVEKLETLEHLILAPIAVLVGVLALGGGLGIVFSIRDQGRISQMHELTVAGEISSQRRTEQSYGSFLEQSQTTIALVNDTLRLAKEASDREARGIENKAKSRVKEIEERAESLMLELFHEEDFERLIEDQDSRHELHAIGEELHGLETSLNFQEVTIPPYSKFVRAMDRFLRDDTEFAIRELQRASQDRQFEDLHRFTLYWLGYMLTTVSEYEDALRMFRADEIGLPKDDVERLQLERMIAETEFFKRARPSALTAGASAHETRDPKARFEEVAPILDALALLAAQAHRLEKSDAAVHTSFEIAQTRADLFTWIAYDAKRLDDPLDSSIVRMSALVAQLDEIDLESLDDQKDSTRDDGGERANPGPAERWKSTKAWRALDNADVIRAWALREALSICKKERSIHNQLNFYVSFALAECQFMLGAKEAASRAFEEAEHLLGEEHSEEREKRGKATLEQSLLICHARLFKLSEGDEEVQAKEKRAVNATARKARQIVQDMRQGSVTVFSQIQRRNVARDEFRDEIRDIVKQAKLGDQDMEESS